MERWVRIRIAGKPLLTAVFLLLSLLVGGVGEAGAVNWGGALGVYTVQPGNQYNCAFSSGEYNWSSDQGLDPPSCAIVSPACGAYVTGFADSCTSSASSGGLYADQKHKIWLAPAGSYTEFDPLVIGELESNVVHGHPGGYRFFSCSSGLEFRVDLGLPNGTTCYYRVVLDVTTTLADTGNRARVTVVVGNGGTEIIDTLQPGHFEYLGSLQTPLDGSGYGFVLSIAFWVKAKARIYMSATPFSTIAVAEKSWQQVKELYR